MDRQLYLVVLGVIGIRVVLDMRQGASSRAGGDARRRTLAFKPRRSSPSFNGLGMPQSGLRGVMLEEGCEMVGNLLLVLSLVLYARHVILDAEGQLPAKPAAKKPEKKEDLKKGAAKAASESSAESSSGRRHDLEPVAKSATPADAMHAHPRAKDDEDDYYEEEIDQPRQP